MSHYGGEASKNPPWLNQGQPTGITLSQLQPQMMTQIGNSATVTMLQYPQTPQLFQQPQLVQFQQTGMPMQTIGPVTTNQITSVGGLSAPPIQPTATVIQQHQLYPQMGTMTYPAHTVIATTPMAVNTASQIGDSSNSALMVASSNISDIPKQRVFTGTITKIQDNFGFIDGEVFFQTSCCRGVNPQVGDKVLVEAIYNANMPFKWNASKVQVLPTEKPLKPLPPGIGRGRRFSSVAHNSFTDAPHSADLISGVANFGRRTRGIEENRATIKRNQRKESFNRKRYREELNSDYSSETKEKDNNDNAKEKEYSKSPSRKISRLSRSRKIVVVTKGMGQIALNMPEANVLELKKRYSSMYIPSDLFLSSFKWVEGFPPHRPLTLERPCAFHVMHKDVDSVIENNTVLDPPDADYLFCAKVMLLSMPELDELYQRCCSLADDDKEGNHDSYNRDLTHPSCMINFLVGLRGKNERMAIGGPWSPSLDGPNPEKDPTVLIKTAIRNCRALTGIDLTNCSQWYRFVEIYYHRAETTHKGKTVPARVETVVLYLPDVWNCLPTRLEWDGLHLNYKKKLDQLLIQKKEAEGDDKVASKIPKKESTHYSLLDPKNMKISDLREELEARNLSSKGMTSQLAARLSKMLKTEQDREEQENAAKSEAEKLQDEIEKKNEEERKNKEEEEKRKLIEKEKELLEKRYTLPEKSHVLVHPSQVAKGGKFDCTVMSLSSLLDYRHDDSKEQSFETSLFAELFNEMLMRDFGFHIYKSLIEAPEKPKTEREDKDLKKEKKDSDRKKEHVKIVTVEPYLLLAFVYFDQDHHGYLLDKEIENLLFSLCLNLSRAQIKKLVHKVESRGTIYYRKLTDKPIDEPPSKQNTVYSAENLATLAMGNKRLFPVFEQVTLSSKSNRKDGSTKKHGTTDLPSGCVMYNGSVLDISNIQTQFKTSEDSRLKLEKILDKVQSENGKLKEATHRTFSAITALSTELKGLKQRLNNSTFELSSINGKTEWYFSLMSDIYEKLSPVFIKSEQNTKEEETKDIIYAHMEDVKENSSCDTKPVFSKEECDVKDEPDTEKELR